MHYSIYLFIFPFNSTDQLGAQILDILSPHYEALYFELKNPLAVAEQLFREKVFEYEMLKEIKKCPQVNGKELLFTHLEHCVTVERNSLKVFATILKNDEGTIGIGTALLDKLC